MPRSNDLWVGKTDDSLPPPRVRDRVFAGKGGRCHKCSRQITPSDDWTLEHVIALINGGRNAEDNLDLTCEWCLPAKNAADAAIKKHSTKVRYRHLGIKSKTSRPIPGSKASGIKRRFDGTTIDRATGEPV